MRWDGNGARWDAHDGGLEERERERERGSADEELAAVR